MEKKEIITLIIVFLSATSISAVSSYVIFNNHNTNNNTANVSEKTEKTEKTETADTLKIGNYSLNYGNYTGIEKEYDSDAGKMKEKKVTLTLSENKINNEPYEVKGTSLYVNGYEMYEVTGNNKLKMLAGSGVEYEYAENR